MIKQTNVHEVLERVRGYDLRMKFVHIRKEIEDGAKIVLKEKTTKNGIYINVYRYDKTCWKYLLSDCIKVW